MEFEAVISLDEEPWERLLDVEGVAHEGSSPSMNYGGLPQPGEAPHFEVTDVSWSDYDPVDSEERGDPVLFYEQHEDEIHEQALEAAQEQYEAARDDYYDV